MSLVETVDYSNSSLEGYVLWDEKNLLTRCHWQLNVSKVWQTKHVDLHAFKKKYIMIVGWNSERNYYYHFLNSMNY